MDNIHPLYEQWTFITLFVNIIDTIGGKNHINIKKDQTLNTFNLL